MMLLLLLFGLILLAWFVNSIFSIRCRYSSLVIWGSSMLPAAAAFIQKPPTLAFFLSTTLLKVFFMLMQFNDSHN